MTRLLLVVAFAIAVGHLAWQARFGPPAVPEYFVGGDLPALRGRDPKQKNLYARRFFHLAELPRHAWLKVVARDRLSVYVNGKLLARESADGFPVATVLDLTPHLQTGPNVIAIVARQASIGQPPVIAIAGTCWQDRRPKLSLDADHSWRCSSILERQGTWWFQPDFEDRHWAVPRVVLSPLRAPVSQPPRAITVTGVSQWITPATEDRASAALRREFTVRNRPRHAWLRVTTRDAYRLAINGIVIDEQEEPLGTNRPLPPIQRLYDITPVVQQGHNVIALQLTSAAEPPSLRADLEVEDASRQRYRVGTDNQWLSRPGQPLDWLASPSSVGSETWQPCVVAEGDLGIPPWLPQRETVPLTLPFSVRLERLAGQLSLMFLLALVTFLACWTASWLLAGKDRTRSRSASGGVVYLALVPATLASAVAVLASQDPSLARQDVYQEVWLWLAVLSVPGQWLLLALLGGPCPARARPAHSTTAPTEQRTAPGRARYILATTMLVLLLAGLLVVGFRLRVRALDIEPLQWDEVENYQYTLGFLERGFPVRKVHEDLPLAYVHTSELTFVPNALAALAFDDDRYVVRFPAACWSALTILLIYLAGRGLFGHPVGLVAAILYTFSPVIIAMSNFGRYFSQLTFFTLLTVYLFWLTIRGTERLKAGALWGAAFSFIAMYLSWEGSALLAVGMMLAALLHRRGRLGTLFLNLHVWLAMLVVLMVIVVQYSHAVLGKTQFLWYGTSLSDLKLRPLWEYPTYQPWFYIWQSSWTQDAFLPMLGLLGAGVLAIRHGYRRPVRFLLVIHLGTCVLMASLLPAMAWRYIHHQIPLLILLASAALIAGVRSLVALGRQAENPPGWRVYAWGVGGLVVVGLLLVGSGMTVQLTEMPSCRVEGYGLTTYKFPNLQGPARYVRTHLREGDVVLATDPFQVKHLMGLEDYPDGPPFFWPESRLLLSATLDDRRSLPLDRRDGTPMLPDRESFQELFARHPRIWYVVQPHRHYNQNTAEVSAFLRQHMEVVYEDFEALVLFRDRNHRSTWQRQANEQSLKEAQADFLPEEEGRTD
jgi:4-amino-4-deoxy-L-arabinose transferase-like glycosyltransferase